MLASSHKFRVIIVVLITAVVFTAVYVSIFDNKIDLNGDNANYYILGKALATGEGYVNTQPSHLCKQSYTIILASI